LTVQQVLYWLRNHRKRVKYDKKKALRGIVKKNRITTDQKNILLKHFNEVSMHPGITEVYELHKLTDITERNIHRWFSTQRFLIKKKECIPEQLTCNKVDLEQN